MGCKVILGCESCVNEWFSGEEALTKKCPACNCVRGYNETLLLRGLNEFLTDIRRIVVTEEELNEDVDVPQLNIVGIADLAHKHLDVINLTE